MNFEQSLDFKKSSVNSELVVGAANGGHLRRSGCSEQAPPWHGI